MSVEFERSEKQKKKKKDKVGRSRGGNKKERIFFGRKIER